MLKTIFLLASASRKRFGELHALSYESHTEGWLLVSLNYTPDFMAKSQNPAVPDLNTLYGEIRERESSIPCQGLDSIWKGFLLTNWLPEEFS